MSAYKDLPHMCWSCGDAELFPGDTVLRCFTRKTCLTKTGTCALWRAPDDPKAQYPREVDWPKHTTSQSGSANERRLFEEGESSDYDY